MVSGRPLQRPWAAEPAGIYPWVAEGSPITCPLSSTCTSIQSVSELVPRLKTSGEVLS